MPPVASAIASSANTVRESSASIAWIWNSYATSEARSLTGRYEAGAMIEAEVMGCHARSAELDHL